MSKDRSIHLLLLHRQPLLPLQPSRNGGEYTQQAHSRTQLKI
jgi:hypothetical protein